MPNGWDISGASNIRNLILPVQSPYYVRVSTLADEGLLWYSRVKGSNVGQWVKEKVDFDLIRWDDFKEAQLMLKHISEQPDLPKLMKELGLTSGYYKASLVYLRGHELAASRVITI